MTMTGFAVQLRADSRMHHVFSVVGGELRANLAKNEPPKAPSETTERCRTTEVKKSEAFLASEQVPLALSIGEEEDEAALHLHRCIRGECICQGQPSEDSCYSNHAGCRSIYWHILITEEYCLTLISQKNTVIL